MNTYQTARKVFFELKLGSTQFIKENPTQFRDALYKIKKRNKTATQSFRTKLISINELKVWRTT